MLTSEESRSIELNLFPSARWIVHERPDFPWHRDRARSVTACLPFSSQALALDFFGTVDRLRSRDAICGHIASHLGLSPDGPWSITPEEEVPRDLLGEPRRTQVDALARGNEAIILFECKFTEADGGACSQPSPITKGLHKGLRQCDGNYRPQVNPVSGRSARCALTSKGVRYWELMPHSLRVDPDTDHLPCPFAGGWYQWMRNLLAAAAMSNIAGARAAFVILYADGPFPMARKLRSPDWRRFEALVSGSVTLRTVSYQGILVWACEAAEDEDRDVLKECGAWMHRKLLAAAT